MITSRKFRNFIWTVILLFPFILVIVGMLNNGYFNVIGSESMGYDSYATNFWGFFAFEGTYGGSILIGFLDLGHFSAPFLDSIFYLDGGLVPFMSDEAVWVCAWFVDYYILVPFLYLFIQLFTFIPTMLIRFMDKMKKENER